MLTSIRVTGLLKEVQLKAEVKTPLEMPNYVPARCESLLECVERMLNLWKYLEISLNDGDCSLKNDIKNPEYHLYIYLIYILLHKLVGYIIFFQKSTMLYDQTFEKTKESYVLFARMILKPKHQEAEYDEVSSIPFNEKENVLLVDEDDFGPLFTNRYSRMKDLLNNAQMYDKKRKDVDTQHFKHAKSFILTTIIAMKNRLPLNNKIINNSMAVYLKRPYSMDVWRSFPKLLPNIITEELDVSFFK